MTFPRRTFVAAACLLGSGWALAQTAAAPGAQSASARPPASAVPWAQIEAQARGQTVYFNAWGGSEATNAYIAWAAKAVKERHGVEVKHVKVTDTVEVVKRVQTELAAGRTQGGSVDLVWINGENFRDMKAAGHL
ncbi:MAG: hypothetical protein Q8M78_04970, partial [Burkholderiaceae bacterium]|nr:hypothetical protein [Burkholderiaceae bacterium]